MQGIDDTSPTRADIPVVQWVQHVLADAVRQGASDIHFEPYRALYRVRLRVDGFLHESAHPPPALASRITARLKVMANMDISERRLPQDGRFTLDIAGTPRRDCRLSVCPTLFGEKLVVRLLDGAKSAMPLDALGFGPDPQRQFLEAIRRPQGMVLITGPTGSGKTVSLYSAVGLLNSAEKNISTIEEPVEIYLDGVNQVEVNLKAGLTFAVALRAFLRQDPDVIMVGEIRDLETAEIAIKAAQTGHLVLSSLHTNSAAEAITRLINLGVAPFNLAGSLSLIVAQRLLRRLCPHCKVVCPVSDAALREAGLRPKEADGLTLYGARGCDRCAGGYKGRIGVFEVLPLTGTLTEYVLERRAAAHLVEVARREGFKSLREAALEKVAAGITSLAEVARVL